VHLRISNLVSESAGGDYRGTYLLLASTERLPLGTNYFSGFSNGNALHVSRIVTFCEKYLVGTRWALDLTIIYKFRSIGRVSGLPLAFELSSQLRACIVGSKNLRWCMRPNPGIVLGKSGCSFLAGQVVVVLHINQYTRSCLVVEGRAIGLLLALKESSP
jgi:hypothetical protein